MSIHGNYKKEDLPSIMISFLSNLEIKVKEELIWLSLKKTIASILQTITFQAGYLNLKRSISTKSRKKKSIKNNL